MICPYCIKEISMFATKCPYCHSAVQYDAGSELKDCFKALVIMVIVGIILWAILSAV
jgi:hypothetical protein